MLSKCCQKGLWGNLNAMILWKEFNWVKKINGVDSQKMRIHGEFSRKSLAGMECQHEWICFSKKLKVKVRFVSQEKQ